MVLLNTKHFHFFSIFSDSLDLECKSMHILKVFFIALALDIIILNFYGNLFDLNML